ncbi:MAG: hypothetical protein ABFD25_18235 [Clostridiaceae bacterium]
MFIDFPKTNMVIEGMDEVRIPKMVRIAQKYDPYHITDIAGHVAGQMNNNIGNKSWYDGKSIAITAGSRGIPHLDIILRTVCGILKSWGATPFIIPAMGSHGGGTAEGQAEMLAGYNITGQSIGVPVRSSMETVRYGTIEGVPLYCDKYAFEADGIVILNKIKPHTDFRGEIESGLCKMIAIGIGKHKGASAFHTLGFGKFAGLLPQVAQKFIDSAPVAFGVGIVQNAYDDICNIDVVEPDGIIAKDKELLKIAKNKIASFKFKELDVLVIDEIGKNISGFGHDPNIVGRINSGLSGFSDILHLQKLFIRGLTEETHHNGCGIAAADVTTRSCLNQIDWDVLWTNMITSTQLNGGRIPLYMNNDYDALRLAIRTCNDISYEKVKLARIKNTLCMFEIEISQSLYEEIRGNSEVEYLDGPYEMKFDSENNLI